MAIDSATRCFAALQKVVPDFEGMRKLPPATDAQIGGVEAAIGLTLPPELAAWLKLLNGHHHGFCLDQEWSFLSTDEIVMHWGFFSEPAQAIAPTIERTDHPHRVKVPANHAKRIPIAADYPGNLLVIDLDPASPEFRGQIVFVERDSDSDSFVVMPTFTALLDAMTKQVDSGELSLVDGNIVFSPNQGPLRTWYERSRAFRLPHPHETSPHDNASADGLTTSSATAHQIAFVAGLSQAQRSACYLGQNQLLQTDQFSAEDLDLVRSIVLSSELAADPAWLQEFPFLRSLRLDGDATPAFFELLGHLAISDLYLAPHTDSGLNGIDALRGNQTIEKFTSFRADQHAFEVAASCSSIVALTMTGSNITDLSSIAKLPKLRTLSINDIGQPDPTPAYQHPTLKEFSLTWRRP
jgi:cell wall assembly regulator SMI1